MKKLLILLILSFTSMNSFSSNGPVCLGDIEINSSIRRVQLTYNKESKSLEAYKTTNETGRIHFKALQTEGEIQLTISRFINNKDEIISSESFLISNHEVVLEVQTDEKHTLKITCFK